jgi:hypothetical protein
MLSGGAGGKYLHWIVRALKATPSALQWKDQQACTFTVNGGKYGEVGVWLVS